MSFLRPKLIEVALPLDVINRAALRDKNSLHGHYKGLGMWWARRPLPVSRAVIWASLVDDPSAESERFPTEESLSAERDRLFDILRRLVAWVDGDDEGVLHEARLEIERCCGDGFPTVLDPFAGSGSVPFEAGRLGLSAIAGDLNPVAVILSKALLEIPGRFAGRPSVNPEAKSGIANAGKPATKSGVVSSPAQPASQPAPIASLRSPGLAADVEAYGRWMNEEARSRLGRHYPDILTPSGGVYTPFAWIWVRTAASPDPAWNGHVPLVYSWTLSTSGASRPEVWVEPVLDRHRQTVSYRVREGGEHSHKRTLFRGNGVCLATGSAMPSSYLRAEGAAGRLGRQLLAVAAYPTRSSIPESQGSASPPRHVGRDMGGGGVGVAESRGGGLPHRSVVSVDGGLVSHGSGSVLPGGPSSRVVSVDGGLVSFGSGSVLPRGPSSRVVSVDEDPVSHRGKGKVFFSPTSELEQSAWVERPSDAPDEKLVGSAPMHAPLYGLTRFSDLYTSRQLQAMNVFSELLADVHEMALSDAARAGLTDDGVRLCDGGAGATAYADAMVTYLALAVNRCARRWTNICQWHIGSASVSPMLQTLYIGMSWIYGEANPFASLGPNWLSAVSWTCKAIERLPALDNVGVIQRDARSLTRELVDSSVEVGDSSLVSREARSLSRGLVDSSVGGGGSSLVSREARSLSRGLVDSSVGGGGSSLVSREVRSLTRDLIDTGRKTLISTDPPSYGSIFYADTSDLFYVWLRKNAGEIWPKECATILTPKDDEIIASKYRSGSQAQGDRDFEADLSEFIRLTVDAQHPDYPATISHAHKTSETRKDGETTATAWDNFLQTIVDAGLLITATWPMRTTRPHRMNVLGANALASTVMLACRPRPASARPASRAEFLAALRLELPRSVRLLQVGSIAPVDLPQAAVGPGLRAFTAYSKVVETDGSVMPVREALSLINGVLGEVFDGEESELDAESRFALAWYAQYGFEPGPFGDADALAQAKNTSAEGIASSGIGEASGGRFRLFRRSELPTDWDPATDSRLTAWEGTQHVAARIERSESEAAWLLSRLGGVAGGARQLAYLLYEKAGARGWDEEASVYNGLVSVWSSLRAMSGGVG